jgi:hypothetical protein
LIVEGFIETLKVAVTSVLGQVPVAPVGGAIEITLGAAHGATALMKVHTKLLTNPMPVVFWAPVVIVAV